MRLARYDLEVAELTYGDRIQQEVQILDRSQFASMSSG
jgi:hypothetical protein